MRIVNGYACGIVLGLAAMLLGGCASGGRASGKVPGSIVDAGEYGENIYDAARSGDWTAAAQKLESLKKSAAQISSDIPNMNSEQKARQSLLSADIAALQKSVPSKDGQSTIEKANDVTMITNQLAAPFGPTVPSDVTQLDCLGRELEVWAGPNNLVKLQATAAEIQMTWTRLRPTVESKGASDLAKKFTSIVGRVAAAKTAKDYTDAATPLLDEVDNLENVFKK